MLGAAARALVQATWRAPTPLRFYVQKSFYPQHAHAVGSCSSRGNLGFNYRIVKLPPELVHYIVVHELCHLKEFNHSPKFWALVAEEVPNWKAARTALRKIPIV